MKRNRPENNYPPQLKAKFLERCVKYNIPNDPSQCWEWLGAKAFFNYGYLKWDSFVYRAHRIAWETWRDIIPEGMFVLHHCDNPSCVNPNHLFIGDQNDNMQDKTKKGRGNQAKGENQGHHKLTYRQVTIVSCLYFL